MLAIFITKPQTKMSYTPFQGIAESYKIAIKE